MSNFLVYLCHLGDWISTQEALMQWESRSYSVGCLMSLQPLEHVPGCFWLTLFLQLVTQIRMHKCNICRREATFFYNSGGCRRGLGGQWYLSFFSSNHQTTPKSPHSYSDWCPTVRTFPSPGSVEKLSTLVGLFRNLSSLFSRFCTVCSGRLIFQAAFHKILSATSLCLVSDISSL